MIEYKSYFQEEIDENVAKCFSDDEYERSCGFEFLVGMRQGIYHASGLNSEMYKQVDNALQSMIAERKRRLKAKSGDFQNTVTL